MKQNLRKWSEVNVIQSVAKDSAVTCNKFNNGTSITVHTHVKFNEWTNNHIQRHKYQHVLMELRTTTYTRMLLTLKSRFSVEGEGEPYKYYNRSLRIMEFITIARTLAARYVCCSFEKRDPLYLLVLKFISKRKNIIIQFLLIYKHTNLDDTSNAKPCWKLYLSI